MTQKKPTATESRAVIAAQTMHVFTFKNFAVTDC